MKKPFVVLYTDSADTTSERVDGHIIERFATAAEVNARLNQLWDEGRTDARGTPEDRLRVKGQRR